MDEQRARELLTAQLRTLDEDTGTEIDDRTPADEAEGGTRVMDVGDGGSQAAGAMDRDLAVGTLHRRREQTVAALHRVDAGTFGVCHACGRRIDDERLETRPETEFCRDHAEGPGQVGPVEP